MRRSAAAELRELRRRRRRSSRRRRARARRGARERLRHGRAEALDRRLLLVDGRDDAEQREFPAGAHAAIVRGRRPAVSRSQRPDAVREAAGDHDRAPISGHASDAASTAGGWCRARPAAAATTTYQGSRYQAVDEHRERRPGGAVDPVHPAAARRGAAATARVPASTTSNSDPHQRASPCTPASENRKPGRLCQSPSILNGLERAGHVQDPGAEDGEADRGHDDRGGRRRRSATRGGGAEPRPVAPPTAARTAARARRSA